MKVMHLLDIDIKLYIILESFSSFIVNKRIKYELKCHLQSEKLFLHYI